MNNKEISLRFFQPSWLLIRFKGRIIYIDPAYMHNYYKDDPRHVEFSSMDGVVDGLPEANLPLADLILITHNHHDHCAPATIRHLVHEETIIAAPGICRDLLAEFGDKVTYVHPGGSLLLGDIKADAAFAYNTAEGSSTQKIHKKGECLGWLLRLDGKTIYHAGDTDFIPEMSDLGSVDMAFLPVGGTYTMNLKEAVEAAAAIHPKIVVPIHDRGEDISSFRDAVNHQVDTRVEVLKSGDSFPLKD